MLSFIQLLHSDLMFSIKLVMQDFTRVVVNMKLTTK